MKKAFGIIIILVVIIVGISSIFSTLESFPKILKVTDAESLGYACGYLFMSFLIMVFSFWVIEKGIGIVKNKKD